MVYKTILQDLKRSKMPKRKIITKHCRWIRNQESKSMTETWRESILGVVHRRQTTQHWGLRVSIEFLTLIIKNVFKLLIFSDIYYCIDSEDLLLFRLNNFLILVSGSQNFLIFRPRIPIQNCHLWLSNWIIFFYYLYFIKS